MQGNWISLFAGSSRACGGSFQLLGWWSPCCWRTGLIASKTASLSEVLITCSLPETKPAPAAELEKHSHLCPADVTTQPRSEDMTENPWVKRKVSCSARSQLRCQAAFKHPRTIQINLKKKIRRVTQNGRGGDKQLEKLFLKSQHPSPPSVTVQHW